MSVLNMEAQGSGEKCKSAGADFPGQNILAKMREMTSVFNEVSGLETAKRKATLMITLGSLNVPTFCPELVIFVCVAC